jgi:TIR domain
MPAQKPVSLFFCYAPEDEALRKELEKHLALLQRQEYITSWSSGRIGPGADRRAEIARHMTEAQVILLLVSVDFLASDDLYDVELDRALARRAEGAHVLGVLLRPTDWAHGKLKPLEMEMLPETKAPGSDRKVVPVTAWPSHDAAFAAVAQALRDRLDKWGYVSRISVNPSEAHPPPAPPG